MKRSREPEHYLDSDSHRADANHSTDSNVAIRHVTKITELDTSAVEDEEDSVAMRCSLPPHREVLIFKSYDEYESHYNKSHMNRCLECRKNFPTEHLLGVHIEECHDPLVLVKREKGEHTYSCFVEGCERKCLTHQKRRMHMIDKHMYPKNFFFAVTRDGIDGRRSLLVESGHHRRRSSTATQSKESRRRASLLEGEGSQPKDTPKSPPPKGGRKESTNDDRADTDMADLTGAMSSLNFVPQSVRFGKGRAGFSKR
ncbi:Fc.00g112110.m01.CDS01 [Cosmosporella sp. VM-42]